MDVKVYVNSVERTNEINWQDFSIIDRIDSNINSCSFSIKKYKSSTVIPSVGQSLVVYDGLTKIFAGTILSVNRRLEGSKLENISIESSDYTHNLGRSVIVERYEDKTVNEIIADLLNRYHIDFDDDYVDCAITIDTITFDNVSVLDAIQKLSEATNYRWYVDYDKKVHFFEKNTNASPFNLADDTGKYVFKSLEITDDISQLRNCVKIRGGDTVGEERSELFDGDDEKLIFTLSNKFSELPTVVVSGTPQSVGVEYLNNEEDYDCLWNYNEKYIRFSSSSTPISGTNNIVITGTPLIPIIVKKMDNSSINTYGLWEFYKRDNTIKSKEEAVQYAEAQLEAYKNSIVEGKFQTYESGLKSGQIINIQSDIRGIDEDFLIQEVGIRMRSPNYGVYSVSLATMRTIGVIDFLQGLLKLENRIILREQEQEPLLTYIEESDDFSMADSVGTPSTASTPYTWEESGTPEANPIIWNMFTWVEG